MKVRYRPVWPGFLLVVSAFFIALWFLGLSDIIQLAIGILLGVVGVLMLTRAYFEYDPATRTILFKAPLSSQTRQFGGPDTGRLAVDGHRIVSTRPDGSHRHLPLKSLFARRNEWDAVLKRISDPGTRQ
jgi:hypothetical protein